MGFGYDGTHVFIASGLEHRRNANVRHDPRGALSIVNSDDPYRSIWGRGEVVEMPPDGTLAFLDQKARLHWDVDEFPHEREKSRHLVKIEFVSVVDLSAR